ncbi:PRC-barrel domain-containing protein [Pseudosulfitobacter koreensis]|uniref:PRC-barrel domain-containing protein n=1 Tax=Pseudosulfitobacter koreensis TaxID=2968472 RepID=A0ABT1Z0L2_9RHOB|nr:PRC-barrel domain-containing protein [Pseudosulfitobacter koreense]MCR8826681.1 PRC-barrel domain-containing protein [Pseudosulfitobacter koreense]
MKPVILSFLCATLAAPAVAQDAEVGSNLPVNTRDDAFLQSADDIDVVSATGEKIGEVEEILINAEGVPAGVLIEFDGFHLFEDDDVAVPLEALEYNGTAYVSKMTEEQLANLRPWDE